MLNMVLNHRLLLLMEQKPHPQGQTSSVGEYTQYCCLWRRGSGVPAVHPQTSGIFVPQWTRARPDFTSVPLSKYTHKAVSSSNQSLISCCYCSHTPAVEKAACQLSQGKKKTTSAVYISLSFLPLPLCGSSLPRVNSKCQKTYREQCVSI